MPIQNNLKKISATRLVLISLAVCTGFLGCDRPAQRHEVGEVEAKAPSPVMVATEASFPELVRTNPQPVLVDFWAEWCGPCKELSPIVEDVARDYSTSLTVAKLNVDDHEAVARQYGIRGIPTLIIFHEGREVDRIVGLVDRQEIEERLAKWLEPSSDPI